MKYGISLVECPIFIIILSMTNLYIKTINKNYYMYVRNNNISYLFTLIS